MRKERVIIFVTKKERTFKKIFLTKFFDTLEINGKGEIIVLEKKDKRNRNLSVENISPYFSDNEKRKEIRDKLFFRKNMAYEKN